MSKYLLLYRAGSSAADQLAGSTPEQAQAGMDAWMAWAGKAGSAIVDLGAPLSEAGSVGAAASEGAGHVGGFSIMEAESVDALKSLLDGHPHLMMGEGAAIDIYEFLAVPGM